MFSKAPLFLLFTFLFGHSAAARDLTNRWDFNSSTEDLVADNDLTFKGSAYFNQNSLFLPNRSLQPIPYASFETPLKLGETFAETGFTIEAWYSDSESLASRPLFYFGDQDGILSDHSLSFIHKDLQNNHGAITKGTSYSLGQSISENEEHHLIVSLSAAGILNVWLDGVQKITNQTTSPISKIHSTVEAIGTSAPGVHSMWGSLNELRIWRGEITPEEVVIHANAGPNEVPDIGPKITSFTSDESRFEGEMIQLAWSIDEGNLPGTLEAEIRDENGTLLHTISATAGEFMVIAGNSEGVTSPQTFRLIVRDSVTSSSPHIQTTATVVMPGIPTADDQKVFTTAGQPLDITLSGTDPNQHPNAELSFEILTQPAFGTLIGAPPNLTYTPAEGFGQTLSFTFVTFDGKYQSEPATISITVDSLPVPPTDITLNTTEFPWDVGARRHIATITADDENIANHHYFTLVPGEGSEANGLFTISGSSIRTKVDLSESGQQFFNIRIRATDSRALWVERTFQLRAVPPTQGGIVINEIHHTPPEDEGAEGFIELLNSSLQDYDLSGWSLSGIIDFSFPAGTILEAGGYLVIAQDSEKLMSNFGVASVGQFTGTLDYNGGMIRLRNSSARIIDEVDFQVGFPWPASSDGGGGSMELIDPKLDNMLGSSWRVSRSPEFIQRSYFLERDDPNWSWRRGITEASSPIDTWRQPEFVEDSSWRKNSQTPIGYGSVGGTLFNTLIQDMRGNYNCIFMRNTFEINEGEVPSQLNFTIKADDGFMIWINGTLVASDNIFLREQPEPTIQTLAFRELSETQVLSRTITDAQRFLRNGENTIAVQVFNLSLNSSDLAFYIDIYRPNSLVLPSLPSPGFKNHASDDENPDSSILNVEHLPEEPRSGESTVIHAKVNDPDGLDEVTLEYQVIAPGEYVPSRFPDLNNGFLPSDYDSRLANPAYAQGWIPLPMNDSGIDGDGIAEDNCYAATIPAFDHRHLIRYRIKVTDLRRKITRAPASNDPSLNFAYFVYDGVPAYGDTIAETMAETLPVYHLLIRNEDYAEAIAYDEADQLSSSSSYEWNATLVYDGKVYDHVSLQLSNGSDRYLGRGKRSMQIRFNEGKLLELKNQEGIPYQYPWQTLTLRSGQSSQNTLTFGLNEAVNHRLFQAIGIPVTEQIFVQWRVIDAPEEALDQWRGDFNGIYLASETYDRGFLKRTGLAKGNLYQLDDYFTQPSSQYTFIADNADPDGGDLLEINQNLTGSSELQYISDRVDLDHYFRYRALSEALRNYDLTPNGDRNMALYFSREYLAETDNHGQLRVLPWNTDLTWGPSRESGHDIIYNAIYPSNDSGGDDESHPSLWPVYFNTVREIRNLLWREEEIYKIIDYYAEIISPLVNADYTRWKDAPEDVGNYSHLNGPGMSSLEAYVADMKAFAFSGGSWPGGNDSSEPDANDNGVSGARGRDAWLDILLDQNGENFLIPSAPIIQYQGPDGFPLNSIILKSNTFNDRQGNDSFGAMEWRLARVDRPGDLEIQASWKSDVLLAFQDSILIPPSELELGGTYRARVRHQDNTGRWSNWSAPLEFTASAPDSELLQTNLRITEVMFHPKSPNSGEFFAGFETADLFEFIELTNIGQTSIDLFEIQLHGEISFLFSEAIQTSLDPGGVILLVRSRAAFEKRYGEGSVIIVEWAPEFRLNDASGHLQLWLSEKKIIEDFTYQSSPPWPDIASNKGYSIVLENPLQDPPPYLGHSWSLSPDTLGTPGSIFAAGSFDEWLISQGETDAQAPYQNSKLSNLLAYALGADLVADTAPEVALPKFLSIEENEISYPALQFRIRQEASSLLYILETSSDLSEWQRLTSPDMIVVSESDNADGTMTRTLRLSEPVEARQFLRLRVTQP